MTLNEALDIFNIVDLTQETQESLKKKYKKLMIKCHPDTLNGDESKAKEVNLAFNVLKETLSIMLKFLALNQSTVKLTVILPLHELINIYSGSSFTLGNEKEYTIDKKEIQKHNTFIITDACIMHNGISYDFTNIEPWTISDNYNVDCNITVDDINKEELVKIQLEDYEKEIKIKSSSVVLKVRLAYNITINIKINKKAITKERVT